MYSISVLYEEAGAVLQRERVSARNQRACLGSRSLSDSLTHSLTRLLAVTCIRTHGTTYRRMSVVDGVSVCVSLVPMLIPLLLPSHCCYCCCCCRLVVVHFSAIGYRNNRERAISKSSKCSLLYYYIHRLLANSSLIHHHQIILLLLPSS